MNKKLIFSFLSLALMSFFVPQKKIRVYLIGDSTMCLYEQARAPLTGWGMPFVHFFDSSVVIDNRARGGRSTRTFISENRWAPIADSLQQGDYVFMQFGHNDEAREPKYADRYTTPTDYKNNLKKFIQETRSKKANPVLITPVSRMKFDSLGNALETHQEYSALVHEVALETKTPLIDLDAKSLSLLRKLGPQRSALLFNQFKPGEHPNYPDGITDNTHFNEYGARRIAELVLAEIKSLKLPLAGRVVVPESKKPGT